MVGYNVFGVWRIGLMGLVYKEGMNDNVIANMEGI